MSVEVKQNIADSFSELLRGKLFDKGINLFNALGYNTSLQQPTLTSSLKEFKESFSGNKKLNDAAALTDDWKFVDLLFQLTVEEFKFDKTLFSKEVVTQLPSGKEDKTVMESYLFFAIDLKKAYYTRAQLSQITREVNKLFLMPALILFRHGTSITLSVIQRRLHRKDSLKDVLEKVTLIKDVNCEHPHRAHIDILFEISFNNLKEKYRITNFVDLHKAWQKALSTKELNQEFYKKLSNWYYYAVHKIKLPIRPEYYASDDDNVKHFTVRLISRIIFCWFLKEKGLIAENLLELYDYQNNPKGLLTDDGTKKFLKENSYYRGVLENIFFVCLNTPMNEKSRKKAVINKRYLPDDFDYQLFYSIPYLNGGLFDKLPEDNCNDRIDDSKLHIPNELFYGKELQADVELKGKSKAKIVSIKTEGFNRILAQYKFTVDENTPLEEEVALDLNY